MRGQLVFEGVALAAHVTEMTRSNALHSLDEVLLRQWLEVVVDPPAMHLQIYSPLEKLQANFALEALADVVVPILRRPLHRVVAGHLVFELLLVFDGGFLQLKYTIHIGLHDYTRIYCMQHDVGNCI